MDQRSSSGRQRLMAALLHAPEGLGADELRARLDVSRTAIYQHLTALERDGLIERAEVARTGGRPGQTYRLTLAGRHEFPKHYALLAELLIGLMKAKTGAHGLGSYMAELGTMLADGEIAKLNGLAGDARIAAIAAAMARLGYAAEAEAPDDGLAQISAYNCVFHHLAAAHEEVCRLDIALLERLSGMTVEHRECMLRGGHVCRFRFARINGGDERKA